MTGLTAADVKRRAEAIGFDLCGVAPVADHPELSFFPGWLERGYGGDMGYLDRTAARRSDVRHVLPSARTVISLGTVYNTDRPYSTEEHDPTTADISRYAWGTDYHAVVGSRTRELLDWMKEANPDPFEGKAYVDTGPVQERVYAQHAGLGWIGKNTCVINPKLGSWMFLSEILCSLPLQTDAPELDQCGTCTLCLAACPTDAIVEPWVLDATRCLSYLTIEVKKTLPEEQRESLGSHVYGCDICQDVCPWNAQAARSDEDCWQPHSMLDRPPLIDLWRQPDHLLLPVIQRSPMSHTGLRNVRRNIAVALGNSGDPGAVDALTDVGESDLRSDPLVGEHRDWARRRLSERD